MVEDKYTYKLDKINDNLNKIIILLNKLLECLGSDKEWSKEKLSTG